MAKMDRDEYYMRIAQATALRGTCDRRQVGAVVVANDRVLSTGFNGAPSGMPECDSVGHLMVNGHCVRTIHAEANAILEVGSSTLRHYTDQGYPVTLYTTTFPCQWCMKIIAQTGVKRVVFGDEYIDPTHPVDEMVYGHEVSNILKIALVPYSSKSLK